MARRILLELLLFLLPFGIFFLYRAASKHMSVRDRWPLTRLVVAGGILAALGLIITPLLAPSAGGKCYRPPRILNGESVPGGYVDCEDAVIVPPPAPSTSPPVAPRDAQPEP